MTRIRSSVRLYKEIEQIVAGRLASSGFRRRMKGLFELPLCSDPDVVGFLGLPTGEMSDAAGTCEISPVVGVRHGAFEDLYARLVPDERDSRAASLAVNIGYSSAERDFVSWTFQSVDEKQIREMLDMLFADGVPFMRKLAEPAELARAIEQWGWAGREYVLPIALAVAGEAEAANELVSRTIAGLDERANSWTRFYVEFVGRFRDYLADQSASARTGE